MEYKYLGNTGVQVSQLCMGTMTFGNEADKDESAAMFKRCRDAGINFFDCANVYSQGKAEEILGQLIQGSRDELIITTKVWGKMGDDTGSALEVQGRPSIDYSFGFCHFPIQDVQHQIGYNGFVAH